MLNIPLKIEQKEAQGFEPLPEDVYQVELLDVSSQEKPTYETRNLPSDKQKLETVLNFQFTLLEGKDGEKELRGRNVWANFVPPYFYVSKKNGKNKLYKIVEGLIGHEITEQEYIEMSMDASLFLNNLVGKQCRVVIEHKQSGEKIFANITNYMKVNSLLSGLTEEEKEKAKVKPKEQTATITEGHPDYVDVNDLPF